MRFINDLKNYFHYTIYATKSQLRSEVANSYLDWVWWILEPFCNMLVYTIIFGYIFNATEPYFPIFIFIGISMWGFFSKTLNASVKLIKNNKSIVTKVYIPKQMLLLKVMFVNAFKMSLSFIIILMMMLFYHVPVNICVLYAVPTFIVLFVLSYGVSCFFDALRRICGRSCIYRFHSFEYDDVFYRSILLHRKPCPGSIRKIAEHH